MPQTETLCAAKCESGNFMNIKRLDGDYPPLSSVVLWHTVTEMPRQRYAI